MVRMLLLIDLFFVLGFGYLVSDSVEASLFLGRPSRSSVRGHLLVEAEGKPPLSLEVECAGKHRRKPGLGPV